MGWRLGSLLISCPSSLQKISGKQRPWCLLFSQCKKEDALSADMEMHGKLWDTTCLLDADRNQWGANVWMFFRKHSKCLKDRKYIKYLHLLISGSVAE